MRAYICARARACETLHYGSFTIRKLLKLEPKMPTFLFCFLAKGCLVEFLFLFLANRRREVKAVIFQ